MLKGFGGRQCLGASRVAETTVRSKRHSADGASALSSQCSFWPSQHLPTPIRVVSIRTVDITAARRVTTPGNARRSTPTTAINRRAEARPHRRQLLPRPDLPLRRQLLPRPDPPLRRRLALRLRPPSQTSARCASL